MSTTLITTPAKSAASPSPASSTYQSSPGRFRHPRLTEIINRRSKVSLTSRDVQNASINAGVLMLSFIFGDVLQTIVTILSASPISLEPLDADLLINLVRTLLLVNIIYCLRPVVPYLKRTDDVNDIPLTPTQRALLGLPPSSTASTTGFVTPPRYRRNSGTINTPSTQATDRRSISANYSSPSLSTSRWNLGFSSPATQRRASGSGSPSANSPGGSPLLYKAVTNTNTANSTSDFDTSRSSFNTSTSSFGLGRSQSMRNRMGNELDSSFGPGTPSPTGRKATGGINYKWLYDKGGRMPKRDSMGL